VLVLWEVTLVKTIHSQQPRIRETPADMNASRSAISSCPALGTMVQQPGTLGCAGLLARTREWSISRVLSDDESS
jgi:hypothetical protein